MPQHTSSVQSCLDTDRPGTAVRAQATEAARNGISATPTLRLHDRLSGKTLLLQGPVEGDALTSAIDQLVGDAATTTGPAAITEMPADAVGDMPR